MVSGGGDEWRGGSGGEGVEGVMSGEGDEWMGREWRG